jgi:AmmeMemoRadiSam system protein B
MVVEAILELDEDRLNEVVISRHISMCGYGSVMSAIVAVKELGSKVARLLSYRTSGDITGDREAVVGYAALSFEI